MPLIGLEKLTKGIAALVAYSVTIWGAGFRRLLVDQNLCAKAHKFLYVPPAGLEPATLSLEGSALPNELWGRNQKSVYGRWAVNASDI